MAMHISDFSKDSKNIVLDLINEQSATNFALAQLDLSVVGSDGVKASTLVATARTGSGYSGQSTHSYNRVLLSEIPGPQVLEYEGTSVKTFDTIAAINALYSVNLGLDDIVSINGVQYIAAASTPEENPDITLEYDVNTPVVVVARSSSLVWVGERSFQFTAKTKPLSEEWPNTNLDGMNPPAPAA